MTAKAKYTIMHVATNGRLLSPVIARPVAVVSVPCAVYLPCSSCCWLGLLHRVRRQLAVVVAAAAAVVWWSSRWTRNNSRSVDQWLLQQQNLFLLEMLYIELTQATGNRLCCVVLWGGGVGWVLRLASAWLQRGMSRCGGVSNFENNARLLFTGTWLGMIRYDTRHLFEVYWGLTKAVPLLLCISAVTTSTRPDQICSIIKFAVRA